MLLAGVGGSRQPSVRGGRGEGAGAQSPCTRAGAPALIHTPKQAQPWSDRASSSGPFIVSLPFPRFSASLFCLFLVDWPLHL